MSKIDVHDACVLEIRIEQKHPDSDMVIVLLSEAGRKFTLRFVSISAVNLSNFWIQNILLDLRSWPLVCAPRSLIAFAVTKEINDQSPIMQRYMANHEKLDFILFQLLPIAGLEGVIIAKKLIVDS